MRQKPTSKNTKAQILEIVDQLWDENIEFKKQVEQMEKKQQQIPMKLDEKKDTEMKTKNDKKETELVTNKIERIVNQLDNLSSGFGDAISELSSQLVNEAMKVAELQQQVQKERAQIENLYDLEITDKTFDELMKQYTEESKSFQRELDEKKKLYDEKLSNRKKEWEKEKEEHSKTIKERNESSKLLFEREAEEYQYNLDLQRKSENAEYELKKKKLVKELEKLEKDKKTEWAERENGIFEQEREFKEHKSRVENFPKELEIVIKKAREEGIALAKREAKIKDDLKAKEFEGIKKINELKIMSLEEVIAKQNEQISDIAKQLDSALKLAQNLALKAIEGASNISSFKAIKDIAMEQAKNVQKNK